MGMTTYHCLAHGALYVVRGHRRGAREHGLYRIIGSSLGTIPPSEGEIVSAA